jgi:hypothetical protein
VERKTQLGEQTRGHLVDARAAGQGHQIAVELHVGRADRPPFAALSRRLTGLDVVVQSIEQVRFQVRERPDDVALDRTPEPVEVDKVGLVELADEYSAMKPVHEQTLVCQQPEGFAQGVAGDVQDLDELFLGES